MMDTDRKVLGYKIVVKPWRKHGNGAKGGGRQGGSGKRCELYKVPKTGSHELYASAEGATAAEAIKNLRRSVKFIPTSVTINTKGETYF